MSILEAFLAGKEARRVADAQAQVSAMQQFIGQNGAALMGGDQNAMAQLAGFGPQGLEMAMGMQDRQRAAEDRAYDRERQTKADARADQKWEMELAEYKKGISAEQAAAEAAQLEEAAKMALTAKSPEDWDRLAQENGAPELVGMFDQREAVAARFMEMSEVLKQTNPEPEKPADEYGRYVAEETAAGRQPLSRIDFAQALKGNGVTQTITNPDGTTTTIQVGGSAKGSGGKPLTEAQSKDNVFATRAAGALQKLETVVDALTDRAGVIGEALDGVTLGLSREALQSPEFQVAKNAGDEFLQAILRKDTGAAITAQEQELYGKTYLPQPGDGPEKLAAKKEARARALAAIQSGMSEEQLSAVTQALANGDTTTADSLLGAAPTADAGPKRLKFNPETGELE